MNRNYVRLYAAPVWKKACKGENRQQDVSGTANAQRVCAPLRGGLGEDARLSAHSPAGQKSFNTTKTSLVGVSSSVKKQSGFQRSEKNRRRGTAITTAGQWSAERERPSSVGQTDRYSVLPREDSSNTLRSNGSSIARRGGTTVGCKQSWPR